MKNDTVNFKKEFKLWKACANDEFRPVMTHILFKNGYAYASDRQVLVRVPLEELTTFDEEQLELLDDCLIHKSMLKYIVGFDIVNVKKTDDGIVYLEARAGENTIRVELAKNGDVLNYPDVEAILQNRSDRAPVQKIGLSPKLISSLMEAIDADRLKFDFTDEKSAVFVRPMNELSNAIGLIMPIMINL